MSNLVMAGYNGPLLLFQPHGTRKVVADFDLGKITTDASGLLLREIEVRFGIVRLFAKCFTVYWNPSYVEISLPVQDRYANKMLVRRFVVSL